MERVGGEHVNTSVLLPPAASPALYEPKPSELRSLSGTDVYFAVDVPFARSVADRIRSAGGDDMRWVRTWQDVDRGHLEGGKPDPHIWLSPRRVKTQAETIAAALSRIDPEHERDYRENLRRFEERVDALDADTTSELEPVAGKNVHVVPPGVALLRRRLRPEDAPDRVRRQGARCGAVTRDHRAGREP